MMPLITGEITFGQHVRELVFGVNVFDLDLRVQVREDATNHMVIWCKYLSGNLCTAVERTSQMDTGL